MPVLKILLSICVFMLLACSISSANDVKQFLQDRNVIVSIYFETGKSQLSKSQQQKIIDLKAKLQNLARKGRLLRVEGFSSRAGKDTDNLDLSMKRAVEVFNVIESMRLSDNIYLTGFGEIKSGTAKMSEYRRVDVVSYGAKPELRMLFQDSAASERFIIQ